MILGEIIISKELLNNEKTLSLLNKPTLNIKTEMDINPEIPTLIIGWCVVSKMFNEDEVSILNKKIKDNLYWTFSPKEDKQEFNENIDEFIDKSYNDFIKDISYHGLDPIIDEFKNPDEFIDKFLPGGKFDNVYLTDDFIYIYSESNKVIYGIDLKYYNFLRFKTDKLIEVITENTHHVLIEDYTIEEGVYQKYKNYLNNDVDKKFIPLIESSMKKELL